MRTRYVLAWAASAALGSAFGQNFNIDFDQADGAAATPPLPLYPGAAAQPGHWNSVDANSPGPVPLTGLGWELTRAVYRRIGGGGAFTFDNPNSGGEGHYLLDDIIDVGPVGAVATVRLEGMIPGLYDVITYAIAPDNSAARTSIFVPGSSSTNPQSVGGEMPPDLLIPGVTHARHSAPVGSDGILAVQATTTAGFGSLNGMQVRLIAPARLHVNAEAAAGGDGTSWARALRGLSEALSIAREHPTVVREIWVAGGPFGAQFPPPADGRAAVFNFTTQASVYGGFAGTETSLSERPALNATILSGAGVGGVGLNADWVVNFSPGGAMFDGRPAVLDGFGIIHGGNDDGRDGGGIRVQGGVVQNCSVAYNRGIDGAVRLSGFGVLSRCTIESNTAVRGGGVHVSGNNAFITHCRIANNTASANGGGVYLSGFTAIQHSLVYLNRAAAGGGIAGAGPTVSPSLTNCTIAHNSAGAFGGLYFVDTDAAPGGPSLFNTIVWGNTDTGSDARRANLEYSAWPLGIGAGYCIIEGFAGGPPFVATSASDPLFTAPAAPGGVFTGSENYTPLPGSPAIDSADSDRLRFDEFDLDGDGDRSELVPVDFRRNARLIDDPAAADTGAGFDPTLDRGAVERVPEPLCPADFNQDGGIDGTDVAAFFAAWENGDGAADVNQDGGIDGADVDTFFAAWEAGGCG